MVYQPWEAKYLQREKTLMQNTVRWEELSSEEWRTIASWVLRQVKPSFLNECKEEIRRIKLVEIWALTHLKFKMILMNGLFQFKIVLSRCNFGLRSRAVWAEKTHHIKYLTLWNQARSEAWSPRLFIVILHFVFFNYGPKNKKDMGTQ